MKPLQQDSIELRARAVRPEEKVDGGLEPNRSGKEFKLVE